MRLHVHVALVSTRLQTHRLNAILSAFPHAHPRSSSPLNFAIMKQEDSMAHVSPCCMPSLDSCQHYCVQEPLDVPSTEEDEGDVSAGEEVPAAGKKIKAAEGAKMKSQVPE